MRVVTPKELSSFKILPFDLYNESNALILSAGEVLTPGKLIMIRNYAKVYTEDYSNDSVKEKSTSGSKSALKKMANYSYDTLDVTEFETVINKENVLKMETQVKIKYFYRKTLDLFTQGFYEEGLLKLHSLVNILITDIFRQLSRSKRGSQIRFLGEYELCHPLNVAIIAGLIARRLEQPGIDAEQVILAALLHDIGKLKVKLSDRSPMITVNEEEVASHTTLGYDLIKNELGLSETIAKAALEHHENNDGSGYPQGLSSDYISDVAQIINVANYYDNLACNRTSYHVASNRDALRAMLEVGTKRFSAKMLYTFIHMFNYDDPKEFNDMII